MWMIRELAEVRTEQRKGFAVKQAMEDAIATKEAAERDFCADEGIGEVDRSSQSDITRL